jgi:outer membrane protein OmpA-like peptidoglycan-associated protein
MVAAAAAAAGLALYCLFGFVALPRLVQWQVPRVAASELQRQGSVGEVRFNPFTLRLVADKLALAESDGRSLASIDRVELQGDWRSPFRRAWSLRELRIEGPELLVEVDPDGRSNIDRLLDTLQRNPDPRKNSHEATPRIVIENIAVTRGGMSIDDRQAGYAEQFTPIELRLNRLSTLPQHVDGHNLTADIASGGRVLWRGEASVNPLRAHGEVTLESVSLRPLGAYLHKVMRVVLTDGALNGKVAYSAAMDGGRVQAQLANGALSIDGLLATRSDAKEPFAVLKRVEVAGLSGDLAARALAVDSLRAIGGQIVVRRDFRGEFDLANLAHKRSDATNGDPPGKTSGPWAVGIKQVQLEQIALRVVDASVEPTTTWQLGQVGLALALDAQGFNEGLKAQLRDMTLRAEGFSASQGQAQLVWIERVNFSNGTADFATRRVEIGRLSGEGGQIRVVRDERGDIDLMRLTKPASAADRKPGTGPEWSVQAHQLALSGLAVEVEDPAIGLRTQLKDAFLRAEQAGTDGARPVPFEAGFRLREGGQFAMKGQAVPAAQSVEADVQLSDLPLAVAQPVLERHLRLKLAGGTVSLQGRLAAGKGGADGPDVRFRGSGEVAALRVLEADGKPFASWKLLSARGVTGSLSGMDIAELRLVGSDASVTIEPNRSINTARLLVRQPPAAVQTAARQGAPVSASASAQSSELFPVRIGTLRVQDSRLKFTDLSLLPQFSAVIHKLNGTIVGLSTKRGSRSQIELDGAVDEYGLARIRGALNPLAPRENTDVNVVFRNIDMVSQSPYAMKFAGYRIAAGRMSLDLRYQVRNSQLAGDNKIVIDQLTLGEKVESPNATKLPVALAINILKDDQGRIDLGLPVSGNLDDPDFSYAALIGKALGTLVTKVITAPFRAMAGGGSTDPKLEAIEFDAGSAQLLPPEREKLARVAQILSKREQFKLSIPAGFAQEADTAALRTRTVHQELARRAGLPAAAQESRNPPDLGSSKMQSAVRDLYAQRFGDAELDNVRVAAQSAPPNTAALGASGTGQTQRLSLFEQLRRSMRGEPQVADTGDFYGNLLKRLEQEQSLPPDALARLGQQRAEAVASALAQAGVPAGRVTPAAPAAVDANDQRTVPLKLALDLH